MKLEFSLENKEFLITQVKNLFPEEACGIIGGKEGIIFEIIPIENSLHSAVKYFMDPIELVNAIIKLEECNQDIIGIYHSHPTGPSTPSETDLKEWNFPDSICVILSPNHEFGWQIRSFKITNNSYLEI